MHRKSFFEIVYGAALIAACSGKLDVGGGQNGVTGNGGSSGAGGGGGAGAARTGGAGGGDQDASAGGFSGSTGGVWHSIPAGGGGGGGYSGGGTAGCFSGPEPQNNTGGMATGGGKGNFGVTPTCPLDSQGFATVDLWTKVPVDGAVETKPGPLCGPYPCPKTSAVLTKGLDCSEVTTERTGFTKTVGCGFETIEFQSYDSRLAYDLEHKYAASFDQSTGELVGLVVKEPYQIEPCMSYAYRAGTVPPDCPSAVTYKCKHVPLTGPGESAYEGCRAPDDPGCAQCCDSNAPDYCNVSEAANGSTIYNGGTTLEHACRCDCTPCAHCKLEDERNMRVQFQLQLGCNCAIPPTGDPCGSWCANKAYWDGLCPGLL